MPESPFALPPQSLVKEVHKFFVSHQAWARRVILQKGVIILPRHIIDRALGQEPGRVEIAGWLYLNIYLAHLRLLVILAFLNLLPESRRRTR